MCPVSGTALLITSLVLSAATGIATYTAQDRAARLKRRTQEQNFRFSKHAAARGATLQYEGLLDRLTQEQEASVIEGEQAQRKYINAVSTATVAAGESGLFGQAARDIETAYALRASEFEANRVRNLSYQESQVLNSLQAVRENQRTAVYNALPGTVQSPNVGAIVGQSLSQALSFFSVGQRAGLGSGTTPSTAPAVL